MRHQSDQYDRQDALYYRVVEKLGGGGMGVVLPGGRHSPRPFRGPQVPAGGPRRGAAGVERFQREARAASALSHSGICTVYDIDAQEGQWFIAMELLEGQTLRERIGGLPGGVGPAGSRDPDG